MDNDAAMEGAPLLAGADTKWRSVFTPGTRRRMNSLPMLMNVLLPWVFFIITFWLWSFKIHFSRAEWLWTFTTFLYILCCVPLVMWYKYKQKHQDPTWFKVTGLLLFISVTAGHMLGDHNYQTYMLSYYSYQSLESYPQVDVGNELGMNLLDAGRVYFGSNAEIAEKYSWHFKDTTLYCVAPIVSKAGMNKDTFDFWAVGTDCCSEAASDFRCGEYQNARARSGLRLMDPATLPFFRLAVNQATELYGVKATTPLFFTWTQDPLSEVSELLTQGYAHFQVAIFGCLVILAFLVAMTTCRFAFLGRVPEAPKPEFEDA